MSREHQTSRVIGLQKSEVKERIGGAKIGGEKRELERRIEWGRREKGRGKERSA